MMESVTAIHPAFIKEKDSAGCETMPAVVYEKYGGPSVLQLTRLAVPRPAKNELLIRVCAASVTAADWRLRKADPFLARIFNGLFRPRKVKVLGFELAGIVVETGADVKKFKCGDKVFAACGLSFGAYAGYKCLPENAAVALKPVNLSFGEAAVIPVGGLTALRLLRKASVSAGHNILIYGASGSVGTYAVQLAKYLGAASVTAVCSTENFNMVKLLGAGAVIDYRKEDFTACGKQFDIVLDAVGKTSRYQCRKLLKDGGRFVTVKSNIKGAPDDLLLLKAAAESGQLRPCIDRIYLLNQVQQAHAYVEQFHKKGNVVLRFHGTPDR